MAGPPARHFTSKKRDRQPEEFWLDDFKLTAQKPKSGSVIAITDRLKDLESQENAEIPQAKVMIDFLDECLSRESRQHLHDRLMDPDDDFDLDDISEILNWVMEVYASTPSEVRPTVPSSASSGRRARTGRTSTAGALSTESTHLTGL